MIRLFKPFFKILKNFGFFLCCFYLFSSDVLAANICDRFYSLPKITATLHYGDLVYKSVPKSEILKLDKLNNPDKTLGVTVADLQINYGFEFSEYGLDKGVCIDLSSIEFFVGYKNLYVLIDNKYPVDSCEYKAIKQHEQKHIKVYQRELKYYGGLLIEELRKLAEDLKPMYFSNTFNHKAFSMNIEEQISSNPVIYILKEKLENSLVKLNQEIDTEQEYLRVKSMCNSW